MGAAWGSAPAPAPLPEIALSDALNMARDNQVAEVVFHEGGTLEVVTKATGSYLARLIRALPTSNLLEVLLRHDVRFRAAHPRQKVNWEKVFQIVMLGLSLASYYYVARRFLNNAMGDEDNMKVVRDSDRNNRRRRKKRGAIDFSTVAGVDKAKRELAEVIDFMKKPERYRRLGARCPKGILLSGPPGCGKTMLARAAANEGGIEFMACSASDFVELYVGRGAARIRELFKAAEMRAPCILFFDEIDALAKARQGGLHGNDEREQTLNQLLTQMDGFDAYNAYDDEEDAPPAADAAQAAAGTIQGKPIVVIAATNRPEILDKALMRPGRFDRLVKVELPDKAGRLAILRVHVERQQLPLADPGMLEAVAAKTRNFSGAELQNIVNEAALLAVRENAETVSNEIMAAATHKVKAAHDLTDNPAGDPDADPTVDEVAAMQSMMEMARFLGSMSRHPNPNPSPSPNPNPNRNADNDGDGEMKDASDMPDVD